MERERTERSRVGKAAGEEKKWSTEVSREGEKGRKGERKKKKKSQSDQLKVEPICQRRRRKYRQPVAGKRDPTVRHTIHDTVGEQCKTCPRLISII